MARLGLLLTFMANLALVLSLCQLQSDCSGHGFCVGGQCACSYGWSGPNCSSSGSGQTAPFVRDVSEYSRDLKHYSLSPTESTSESRSATTSRSKSVTASKSLSISHSVTQTASISTTATSSLSSKPSTSVSRSASLKPSMSSSHSASNTDSASPVTSQSATESSSSSSSRSTSLSHSAAVSVPVTATTSFSSTETSSVSPSPSDTVTDSPTVGCSVSYSPTETPSSWGRAPPASPIPFLCLPKPHPWSDDTHDTGVGYGIATFLTFAVFGTIVMGYMRIQCRRGSRGLLPLIRAVQVTPSPKPNVPGSPIIALWCCLEIVFRSAPFSFSVVDWSSVGAGVAAAFLHRFLFIVPQSELLLTFLVIAPLPLAAYFRFDRPRLQSVTLHAQSMNSIVPGNGAPYKPAPPPPLLASPLSWLALGAARLLTSILLIPFSYILLNTFVCAGLRSRAGFDSTAFPATYFVTTNCGSGLVCYGPLHWIAMAVALIILIVTYFGVLTVTVPTAFVPAFGMPHLLLATIPVKLVLAWSAHILYIFSPVWSVMVSLWANVTLLCLFLIWLRTVRLPRWCIALYCLVNIWCVGLGIASAVLVDKGSGASASAQNTVAINCMSALIIGTVLAAYWLGFRREGEEDGLLEESEDAKEMPDRGDVPLRSLDSPLRPIRRAPQRHMHVMGLPQPSLPWMRQMGSSLESDATSVHSFNQGRGGVDLGASDLPSQLFPPGDDSPWKTGSGRLFDLHLPSGGSAGRTLSRQSDFSQEHITLFDLERGLPDGFFDEHDDVREEGESPPAGRTREGSPKPSAQAYARG